MTRRYLLDTHAFAWAVSAPGSLSEHARAILEDPANTLLVSAANVWEMSIKHHLGKWVMVAPLLDEQQYGTCVTRLRAVELPITAAHGRLAGQWKVEHRDPFDRLLAAQALLEGVPLISRDTQLDLFPITRVW